MYQAKDIAIYIVNYCNGHNIEITNLKLQKLLYFIQGGFYIIFDQPCFKEDIECWQYGPSVSSVYSEFRIYGSRLIPKVDELEVYDLNTGEFVKKAWEFKFDHKKHKNLVDTILNGLSKYSAYQLVDITHNQKPWKEYYEPFSQNVIPKKRMRSYFRRSLTDHEE